MFEGLIHFILFKGFCRGAMFEDIVKNFGSTISTTLLWAARSPPSIAKRPAAQVRPGGQDVRVTTAAQSTLLGRLRLRSLFGLTSDSDLFCVLVDMLAILTRPCPPGCEPRALGYRTYGPRAAGLLVYSF